LQENLTGRGENGTRKSHRIRNVEIKTKKEPEKEPIGGQYALSSKNCQKKRGKKKEDSSCKRGKREMSGLLAVAVH